MEQGLDLPISENNRKMTIQANLKIIYFFRAPADHDFNDSIVQPEQLYVELLLGGIVYYEGEEYRRGTVFCHTAGHHTIHDFPDGHAYRALMILFDNYHADDFPHISRWNRLETLDSFVQEAIEDYCREVIPETLTEYIYSTLRHRVRLAAPPVSQNMETMRKELYELKMQLAQPDCDYRGWTGLARRAGYSPSYLKSLFNQAVGVPPYQYYLQCRLQRAAAALRSTDRPIDEIAHEIGYVNIESFYRIFKLRYRMPPGAYRKNSRKQ